MNRKNIDEMKKQGWKEGFKIVSVKADGSLESYLDGRPRSLKYEYWTITKRKAKKGYGPMGVFTQMCDSICRLRDGVRAPTSIERCLYKPTTSKRGGYWEPNKDGCGFRFQDEFCGGDVALADEVMLIL